jgi:hypothetical protein
MNSDNFQVAVRPAFLVTPEKDFKRYFRVIAG